MLEDNRRHIRLDDNAFHDFAADAGPMLVPLPEPTTLAAAYRGFELPRSVWISMLGCYAVFFIAIAIATGGSGSARFAIVVSVLFTTMYFGTARVAARQAGREACSPLERGEDLQTWCGPMERTTVYGQILVVPAAIALFGIGIAVIRAFGV